MPYYKILKKSNEKFAFKIGSRHYGEYDYALTKILLALNFKISSKGFEYWKSAIRIYSKYRFKYNNTIENVYFEVAMMYNTTRSCVERAMRTASVSAKDEIRKKFNYNSKLSTKVILSLIVENYCIIRR